MLTRLYVDNFRTLVNFELKLDPLTLLLGPNGSGKTTALETIRLLRDFLAGDKNTSDLFDVATLTRWQDSDVQTFVLTFGAQKGSYAYHLEIEHERSRRVCRVKRERLLYNNKPLYESSLDGRQLRARLYRDDFTEGPEVLVDWTRSGVAFIQPRYDNKLLTAFKERVTRTFVLRFDPARMSARAEQETDSLAPDGSNFVAWFRYISDLDFDLSARLKPLLAEVIPGYETASLVPDGADAKLLKVRVRTADTEESPGRSCDFRFDELSDGQRVLYALYTLLAAADSLRTAPDKRITLCLDEPENFVALREVHPWLNMLIDRTQGQPLQAVLISHHPELINALAVGAGRWLDRTSGGATRVQTVSDDEGTGLPVSELVARGWLHA